MLAVQSLWTERLLWIAHGTTQPASTTITCLQQLRQVAQPNKMTINKSLTFQYQSLACKSYRKRQSPRQSDCWIIRRRKESWKLKLHQDYKKCLTNFYVPFSHRQRKRCYIYCTKLELQLLQQNMIITISILFLSSLQGTLTKSQGTESGTNLVPLKKWNYRSRPHLQRRKRFQVIVLIEVVSELLRVRCTYLPAHHSWGIQHE